MSAQVDDSARVLLSIAKLIEIIHERRITLTYDARADRMRLTAPAGETIPRPIIEAGRAHRAWLANIEHGRRIGVALAPCTVCSEPTMTAAYRTTKWPHCRFTPGCKGRHEPRPVDLIGVARVKAVTIKQVPKYEPKFLLGPTIPYPPIR